MIQFTYTGPLGNHGGESRFPLSCNNGRSGGRTTKLSKKKGGGFALETTPGPGRVGRGGRRGLMRAAMIDDQLLKSAFRSGIGLVRI